MTSPQPQTTPTPSESESARPADPAAAALYDALVTEHATIYGYGIVSAHSTPEDNWLVGQALARHREQRETLIAMLDAQSVQPPLAAPGYQLPSVVNDPTEAATLAVQMENDTAAAWRAVIEQAGAEADRAVAVGALTHSAVLAARWQQVLGVWPVTEAFPGGPE
ncbi:ferritin-like domain-containing protein [Mycolicibacterium mengxianglii]|uniref:ferritin-like domain-containing protein n=1 Tax=Mycolicibacterium mengxianglii TaxID=2736649 RepID=UPI0018D0E0AA|nr:ferritin-like domain-containing protein [Mycolicibacterium mengxianglii]